MIRDMFDSKLLKSTEMAAAAGCSDRTIRNIKSNLRCFNATRAPFNGGGRRQRRVFRHTWRDSSTVLLYCINYHL
jgi:hypothetical protein